MSIEKQIALVTLEVSRENLKTAKLAHEKMTQQLDARVMTLASMAATIISNAHPQFPGVDAMEAVKLAAEILHAAELKHNDPALFNTEFEKQHPKKEVVKPKSRFYPLSESEIKHV